MATAPEGSGTRETSKSFCRPPPKKTRGKEAMEGEAEVETETRTQTETQT